MSADTEQRKLAAIMFTDMAGYSRLAQRDEKLALQLLEEHRALLRSIFPKFNGTEVKTIGDGFLVEFNSALEAAQCAIEIQRALANRNHNVPSDRRIDIRIGIHIGDVVHRAGDVYGDGVNIASRIDYDGDAKDILNFQSNGAEQVVQALKMKLGVAEARALEKKPTDNSEAHRLYLLGRYHLDKFTEADVVAAVGYFEQALQVDPNFALAYCGLADAYEAKGGNTMASREAWAKQKIFARKALALDPDLPEAHLSFGTALMGSFDWANARNEINRALELNPNLALAHDASAWLLTIFGRFDEAVEKEKKALELDPLNPYLNDSLGWSLYWAGRYDEAMQQLRSSIELFPNNAFSHFVLGWCLLKKGNAAEAMAELQKAANVDDLPWYIGWLGYAYGVSGEPAKADQILHDLGELAKKRYVTPGALVPVYLGLGDKEKTLDWLEKSYEEQDGVCWQLKIDQRYNGLRNEPRFQALVQAVFPETQ